MSDTAGIVDRPKWLVIQLARFGDLMQTAPVIAGAAKMPESPHIDLVVDKSLSDLALSIEGIDNVLSVEGHNWLAVFDDDRTSWIERMQVIGSDIDTLRKQHYNKVINLTHTPVSAYMASMVKADSHTGLFGERRGVYSLDPWERYFQVILTRRHLNPFNLVDIHIGIAGVNQPRGSGQVKIDTQARERYLSLLHRDGNAGVPLIAVQLGANSPLRRWDVERFAAVAQSLNRKTGAQFVLVGSNDEVESGERFTAHYPSNTINLIGKTSLCDLVALLSCCDLMISGDTGTLHLAAAVGIPTVSLFFAMARPEDTAPYGEGHVILTPKKDCYPCQEHNDCAHRLCHDDVTLDDVAAVVDSLLKGNSVLHLRLAGCRLNVTGFDENGFQILSERRSSDIMQIPELLRSLWNIEFNGVGDTAYSVTALPVLAVDVREGLRSLLDAAENGERKISQAFCSSINEQSLRAIERSLDIIDESTKRSDLEGLLAHIYLQEQLVSSDNPLDRTIAIHQALCALARRIRYLLSNSVVDNQPDHPTKMVERKELSCVGC